MPYLFADINGAGTRGEMARWRKRGSVWGLSGCRPLADLAAYTRATNVTRDGYSCDMEKRITRVCAGLADAPGEYNNEVYFVVPDGYAIELC